MRIEMRFCRVKAHEKYSEINRNNSENRLPVEITDKIRTLQLSLLNKKQKLNLQY